MSAPNSGQGPEFEPQKRVLREIADFLYSAGDTIRSASNVWETLADLGIARWKFAAVVVTGLAGGIVLPTGTALLGLPVRSAAAIAAALQLPWLLLAARSTAGDSARRKLLHRLRAEENSGQERREQAIEWRRELASFIHNLPISIEDNPAVAEVMAKTVERFTEAIGCKLALALVRRKRNGEYRVVKTAGEMSDCLKEGTKWNGRDADIHEYVKKRSLYPSYTIEHQTLGKAEYYLVAIAEIDVIGGAKQCVLDAFHEMVLAEVGLVISDRVATERTRSSKKNERGREVEEMPL